MLALFNPDTDPPEEIKKLTPVYVDKKQEPLALVPLSEEEQVVCLKSVFVYNINVHLLPFFFLTQICFFFVKRSLGKDYEHIYYVYMIKNKLLYSTEDFVPVC